MYGAGLQCNSDGCVPQWLTMWCWRGGCRALSMYDYRGECSFLTSGLSWLCDDIEFSAVSFWGDSPLRRIGGSGGSGVEEGIVGGPCADGCGGRFSFGGKGDGGGR